RVWNRRCRRVRDLAGDPRAHVLSCGKGSKEHHECHRKSCKCLSHRMNLPTFCDTGPELAACLVRNGCADVRPRSLPDRTSPLASVGAKGVAPPKNAAEGCCAAAGQQVLPPANRTATVANWTSRSFDRTI